MKQSRIIEQLLAEQVVYNLTMAHFCMAEIVPLYELHYPKEIKTKFKKQKLLHLFFTSEKNLPSSTLMLLLHYLPSVVHQAQIRVFDNRKMPCSRCLFLLFTGLENFYCTISGI